MSDPDPRRQLAHLERITAEQLDEIEKLQQLLESEQDKCAQQSNQIEEMTQFLADYGLHWVGGPAPAPKSLFPRGPIDMSLFNQRLAELNAMADPGLSFKKVKGMARLSQDSIRIILKDDGFIVADGPLRSYLHPLSSDFFQDIMDGFFPVEFKTKYPEGVCLTVEDLRENDLFKGDARRLVDSARRERREVKGEWQAEIGDGEGKLKVKFSNGKETIVKTSEGKTVATVCAEIEQNLGVEVRQAFVPPSQVEIDRSRTIGQLGLYPQGLIIAFI
jgi:hypothetical protein